MKNRIVAVAMAAVAAVTLMAPAAMAAVSDFCVADLTAPATPSGFPCKKEETLTVEDFVFSGLGQPGNTTNFLKASVTPAFDYLFPAVNGLGVSTARLDLDVGGVFPLHVHPYGNELMVVTQGRILAGFISSGNKLYYKTLKKGDAMVFPQGLLHFRVNVGSKPAVAFSSYNSANAGIQVTAYALFETNFPSELISRTTFLSPPEVQRLKAVFGGTG
ncbi:auxin-binding protein ABP20-like [Wolffia australiana]